MISTSGKFSNSLKFMGLIALVGLLPSIPQLHYKHCIDSRQLPLFAEVGYQIITTPIIAGHLQQMK